MRKLQGHTAWITALAFSSDSTLLASGLEDGVVQIWSLDTGQCIHKLENSDKIGSVAFSAHNIHASGSCDGVIQL